MAFSSVELKQFCRKLPKVELHAHLNGSISMTTMEWLLSRYEGSTKKEGKAVEGQEVLGQTPPELWQTTIAKGERRTMEECFLMFKIVHALVNDEAAVEKVARDVVLEFAEDSVVYLELRTTPRANPATNMTKRSYIDAVLSGIGKALVESTSTIHVRLLLSIDRRQTIAEAKDTVDLALEYQLKTNQHQFKVIGVDLSGDPACGNITALVPVLRLVKEKGLKLSVHIAEIPNRIEEGRLLLSVEPDRLGHGTFLHASVGGSQDLVDIVMAKKIPIELCLTSNVKCRTVATYNNHHFAFWKERNHPLIICTDDKGIFSTTLSEEYAIAAKTLSLTVKDLQNLSCKAVQFTFESDSFKRELEKNWI